MLRTDALVVPIAFMTFLLSLIEKSTWKLLFAHNHNPLRLTSLQFLALCMRQQLDRTLQAHSLRQQIDLLPCFADLIPLEIEHRF